MMLGVYLGMLGSEKYLTWVKEMMVEMCRVWACYPKENDRIDDIVGDRHGDFAESFLHILATRSLYRTMWQLAWVITSDRVSIPPILYADSVRKCPSR